MTDARWSDVFSDIAKAKKHFGRAVDRFPALPEGEADAAYDAEMAIMHMMLAGHTAAETALRRVLSILGEALPTGPDSHARLIDRCASAIPGERPALISPELKQALKETRQFRHVAMHTYDHLDRDKARFAIEAARIVVSRLEPEAAAFRDIIDPPA